MHLDYIEEDSDLNQVIISDEEGRRLDAFLAERVQGISRTRIGKLIKDGLITVNGRPSKPSYQVEMGDRVNIELPPPETHSVKPEPVEFTVVHEDESMAVIDKPPGLVVHCTETMLSGTLVNGLLHRFDNLSNVGGEMRQGIVHRLDKDTSGLMLVAKTNEAHIALMRMFEHREIKKQYLALVHGNMDQDRYEVALPIERNPHNRQLMTAKTGRGREAFSLVEVLERFEGAAFVCISPRTGRTHQVRVHLSAMGHPIVADKQYGGRAMEKRPKFGMTRQALHAYKLSFAHPTSGEQVDFEAPLPKDMLNSLATLRGPNTP
ncbi:MAG: RluA family pseudouridine synthase [Candidatus Coatesbacteria bacterium]|nr:RluA family pseudouridine synthase [Candidatus Coatesbacteria bacterium]